MVGASTSNWSLWSPTSCKCTSLPALRSCVSNLVAKVERSSMEKVLGPVWAETDCPTMFAVKTNTTAKPKNVLRVDGLVFIALMTLRIRGYHLRSLDDDGNFYQNLTIVKTRLRFLAPERVFWRQRPAKYPVSASLDVDVTKQEEPSGQGVTHWKCKGTEQSDANEFELPLWSGGRAPAIELLCCIHL